MSEPRVRLTKVSIYTFVLKPTFSRKELLKCNKKHFEHWKCCKTANLSWSSSLSEIQSCIHFRRVLSFLTSRKRTQSEVASTGCSLNASQHLHIPVVATDAHSFQTLLESMLFGAYKRVMEAKRSQMKPPCLPKYHCIGGSLWNMSDFVSESPVFCHQHFRHLGSHTPYVRVMPELLGE